MEAFLDESRGGTGWGTEDTVHWSSMGLGALSAGGLGGGGHGGGNASLPTATRGTGGERLLGSLTPVLVRLVFPLSFALSRPVRFVPMPSVGWIRMRAFFVWIFAHEVVLSARVVPCCEARVRVAWGFAGECVGVFWAG